MKLVLFSILILPVTVLAARVGGSDVQKALDGRSVSCVQDSDLGKGGYAARDLEVRGIEGDLQVSLTLPYVQCAKIGDDFYWLNSEMPNPIETKDLLGSPIRIWQADREFVLTNSNSKEIGASRTPASTSFRFPLEQVLDDKSRDDLGRGLQVGATVRIFPRSVVTIERDGQSVLYGRTAGGAYNIRFTLWRDPAGVLNVRSVEIR